jgi:hypothetical protein
MELIHLQEIIFNDLPRERFDCFIAACGYQPRCYYLAEKIDSMIPRKYLLTIDEPDQLNNRCKHLEIFKQQGFKNYYTAVNESKAIEDLVSEICDINSDQLNLLIDYSCMPKKWYALIIDSISRNNFRARKINLFLSYTPKLFERNPEKKSIDYIGPMLYNRDNLKDKKPVSMIASLDNNPAFIIEAVNKVRPQHLLAFIPQCAHDPDYTRLVLENNKTLLDRLDNKSIIPYDANRPKDINAILTSHCLDERITSEVLILPQGPKTFSMMSLLLSVRYPDIKLWEIVAGERKTDAGHGLPAANPVIVKVTFLNDEADID